MAELVIAPSARSDLLAQWNYFACDVGSPDLADHFVLCAERTFRTLLRTPGLGRPRKFLRVQGLRSWSVDGFARHLVFYRVLPEAQGVEIVRVIHGAMDLAVLFGG